MTQARLALDRDRALAGVGRDLEAGGRFVVDRHGPRDPGPRLEAERHTLAERATWDERESGIAQGHEQEPPVLRRQREATLRRELRPGHPRSLLFRHIAVLERENIIGWDEIHEPVLRRRAVGILHEAA